MQFTGRILSITDKIFIGANNTPKISIILEEAEDKQYKDSIMIDWIGDEKVTLIEGLEVGSVITAHFNLRTTEYNGRYYNNINGWRIEGQASNNNGTANTSKTEGKSAEAIEEDFEDLPF